MRLLPPLLCLALIACPSDDAGGDPDTSVPDVVADTAVEQDGVVDAEAVPDVVAGDAVSCFPNLRLCLSPTQTAVCNATGDGYSEIDSCEEGLYCQPDTKQCQPGLCEPGESECRSIDTFRVCAEDGSHWGDTQDCPAEWLCLDTACSTCKAGDAECVGDASYRECREDGQGWTEELACPGDDAACIEGQCCTLETGCLDNVSFAHTCTAGEEVLWQDVGLCAEPATCVGAGECHVCEPDTKVCSGDTSYRTCASDGSGYGEPTDCQTAHVCIAGDCTYIECLSKVLLVVDRSGSMSGQWTAVENSVKSLLASNQAIFGLMSFPSGGSCNVPGAVEVPLFYGNGFVFDDWFTSNGPGGATPLLDVVEKVHQLAATIFEGDPGVMVVLSDGEDTCASGNLPQQLGDAAAALYADYAVQTYVIGYNFGGDEAELDALASNGGTELTTFIEAGDEASLTDAFQGIVNDLKLCD